MQTQQAPTDGAYTMQRDEIEVIPDTRGLGWIAFAATMLFIVAAFQAIAGFIALFNDTYYVVTSKGLAVSMDYTAWGWTHLGIGLLVGLAGFSLLRGHMYGRIVGVLAASVSLIANALFVAAFPIWSVIVITLDVFVIHAIIVHGGKLNDAS